MKGEEEGIERNARREGHSRKEGGRVSFPPHSRALAFISRLKLPFPPLLNACHAGYFDTEFRDPAP